MSGCTGIDFDALRATVDLAELAVRLLGPPPGRRGESGRRKLWWPCPFHADRNPSLRVEIGRPWWVCHGCGLRGDAVDLVRRLNPAWSLPEAVQYLTDGVMPSGAAPTPRQESDAAPSSDRPAEPAALSQADAQALVADSGRRLWTDEGRAALAYLRGRGLADETIRAARLGVVVRPRPRVPWLIAIPWFDGDHLARVKARQAPGAHPRYRELYRSPRPAPGFYLVRPPVRAGRPLIVTEGELDALLLGQELGDLAAVVTLGSSDARPGPSALNALLPAVPWYVATDADEAGDAAAARWPAHARRVRPPGAFKDWTEAHLAGTGLRRWWADRLGGIEVPPLHTWPELAALRWGPAIGDPTPGIVIDRPDRGRMRAAVAVGNLCAALTQRGIRLDGALIRPRVEVGTVTGRITYSNPCLQNLPEAERLVRLGPVVAGRVFVRADYGQIEPRILLSILRDRGLIAWDAGEDLYRDLIADASVDRDVVKVQVNKLINGGRPEPGATGRLAEFIRAADAYRAELAADALEVGWVATLSGRRIMLPAGAASPPPGVVVNRVVQGSAADVFHRAAVRVADALEAAGLPAAVAFLLFDELWVESDPAEVRRVEALVRAEMEAAAASDGLTIPVRLEGDGL